MPKLELRVTDCTPEQAVAIAAYIAKLNGGSGHNLDVTHAPAAPRPQPPAPPAPPSPPMATAPQPPAPPAAPQPPSPPTVPSTPPAPGAELDSRGVPYHPDHHAATKGKTKDGAWMRKKGSDKDVVAVYEAQFTHRPTGQAPQPPAPPVAPQAPASPPLPPAAPQAPTYPTVPAAVAHPTAAQINAQHAPHLPPQGETVAPPAPLPPAAQHIPTYAEFYQKYMDLLEAKLMTGDQARQINERVGAVTGAEYADNEHMRAIAWAEFLILESFAQAA